MADLLPGENIALPPRADSSDVQSKPSSAVWQPVSDMQVKVSCVKGTHSRLVHDYDDFLSGLEHARRLQ